jgi:hypothetical protein
MDLDPSPTEPSTSSLAVGHSHNHT